MNTDGGISSGPLALFGSSSDNSCCKVSVGIISHLSFSNHIFTNDENSIVVCCVHVDYIKSITDLKLHVLERDTLPYINLDALHVFMSQ